MQNDLIHHLPVDQISARVQVRRHFDEAGLADMAQTIRDNGVEQPIHVWRDGERYVVLMGERRWRAAKLAGCATVPALVVDAPTSDAEVLVRQLVENMQRADLLPLEQAEGIRALMEATCCNASEAAKRIGKSKSTVSKLLALLSLPESAKTKLADGTIGLRAGHELARARGDSAQPTLVTKPERKPKHTAVIDDTRSVTIIGTDGTMDGAIDAVETVGTWLRAAKKQGVGLDTALAIFRDKAKRGPSPAHH